MGCKKNFTFLLILLISFGVMGVVSAEILNIEVVEPNDGAYSGSILVEWAADGCVAGDYLKIYWGNGGTIGSPEEQGYINNNIDCTEETYSWDISEFDNGNEYQIKIKSASDSDIFDYSNNFFTIDNTPPTIDNDYGDSGSWVNSAQTVTLTPEDTGGSGLKEVKWCTGTTCTPDTLLGDPYELDYTTSQNTIVRYQAFDNAGNPSAVGEFNVKIDLEEPVASIGGVPSGLIVDKDGVTATIGCEDDTSGCGETKYMVYTTDPTTCSSNPAEYTSGTSVEITEHSWVCAYATDNAGNGDFSDAPVEFNVFSTIQDAIDAASSGNTIEVADGTYTETLDINIPLTLIGESRAGTIIDASGSSDYGISITANDVTVESLTLLGPNNYGFKPSHISNLVLRDLLVQGSGKTEVDLNTINIALIEDVEANGLDTSGFGLMIFNSNDITVTNVATSGNVWGGVSVQNRGQVSDNINFAGTFSATDDFPFLVEQDPDASSNYYDINVQIPDKFNYVVYDFREGDNYKQWYYFETLDDAKTTAQGFVTSGDPIYSGVVIYDTSEENYYVEEGMLIQDAIDAAEGTTVHVGAGTYEESILIDESLTLIGEGGVIVTGDDLTYDYIVKITADNVIFDNFEVNGGGIGTGNNAFDYGIWVSDADNVEIANSFVTNIWKVSSNGIQVDDSINSDIHGNTISHFHKRGIRYVNSDGLLYDNEIFGESVNGVDRVQNLVNLWTGSDVEIYNNDLHNALTLIGSTPLWDSPAIFVSSYHGSYPDSGSSYANIHDNEIYNGDSGIVVGSVYALPHIQPEGLIFLLQI